METVFHDVPFAPGFKSFDKRKLVGQIHSVLLPAMDLVLADLSNVSLRKLGVPRAQLIDTEKDRYPETRMGRSDPCTGREDPGPVLGIAAGRPGSGDNSLR